MGQKVVIEDQPVAEERHVEIRVALARTNLRQRLVAEKVGITEGHLSHLLAGRKPLSEALALRLEAAIAELAP